MKIVCANKRRLAVAGERFTAFADLKTAYLTFPLYVFMLIDKLFFITSRMNFIDIFNSATVFLSLFIIYR